MVRRRRHADDGYLSVIAGTVTVRAGFVVNPFTLALGTVSMTPWLVWTALVMRSGPGMDPLGSGESAANGRTQRRDA